MTTLGIFAVKRVRGHQGVYYTSGGFGGYLAEIRKYFDKVVLVVPVKQAPPPAGWYRIPMDDLEVVHLPPPPTELGKLIALPVVIFKALTAIRRMDVVHARLPDYTGVAGSLAARLHGVPCFHQIVGDWQELAANIPATKAYGLGFLLKMHMLLYDRVERWVCRNQLVFAQGEKAYAKHAGSSACHLVLSSAHYRADVVEPSPKFQREPFVILSVGRLQIEKNHPLIVRALAKLRAKDPRWRFVLVGEGPHEAALRALIDQLGITDSVVLAGQLDRGAPLWSQYDASDVFVLSSFNEGTPKVVLEAMARGLPVVATNVGGVPTAVANEQRGLLVPSGDVDALVAALERMAADAELRARCQRQAHEFAMEHTLEISTRRMLEAVARRWPQLKIPKLA